MKVHSSEDVRAGPQRTPEPRASAVQSPGQITPGARDFREQKKARLALKDSERRFRDLWENAPVAYHTADTKGTITNVNQTEARMLGYRIQDLVGTSVFDLMPPEQRTDARSRFQAKISGQQLPRSDNRIFVRKDGTRVHVVVDDKLERDAAGEIVGIWSTLVDITKLKESEEALRTSEEHFRDLVEKSGVAVLTDDCEGNIIYFNDRYAAIFGYSHEEMRTRTIWSTVHPDDVDKLRTYHTGRLEGRDVPARYELKAVRKDGSTIFLEIDTVAIRDGSRPIGTYSYMRDITERKRAEAERRESDERLRSIVQHSHDGILILNGDFRIIFANPEAARISGYAQDEIVGRDFTTFIDDESRKLVRGFYLRRQRGEKVPPRYEFNIIRKDGEKRRLEISSSVVAGASGKIETIAQLRDITERKRAEEARQRIEWMLSPGHRTSFSPEGAQKEEAAPGHGNLVALNTSRVILDAVGSEMLRNIVVDFLDLLDTSAAIYEVNGDYACALSSSAWCRFMRQASRRRCGTEDDSEALARGKWLCHESCWTDSSKISLQTGAPVDIACNGGIRCYAVPIRAGTEIVGSIKIGYGDPPRDPTKLGAFAAAFGVSAEDLAQHAGAYESRPPYIIEMAKRRLEASARLIGEIVNRKRADSELKITLANLRKITAATVQAMAAAVETRDPYTAGHQKRVADLARAIAEEMGLPRDKIEGIRTAGVIHDLGKLSVPTEILSKPTKLSDFEFALIKTHSQKGFEILKDISFPWPVARIVLEHHERMDGSGYPQGLKGEDTLIESRILAVADVVEAIASHRPYRPARGIEAALEEIARNRGLAYDPDVVIACLKVFERGYQFLDPGRETAGGIT